jgi:hypothetical protein
VAAAFLAPALAAGPAAFLTGASLAGGLVEASSFFLPTSGSLALLAPFFLSASSAVMTAFLVAPVPGPPSSRKSTLILTSDLDLLRSPVATRRSIERSFF